MVDGRFICPAPHLGMGEIHIWRFELTSEFSQVAGELLPKCDWERAGRFVFDRDRNRFLHGRLTLRRLLAWYLRIDPSQLMLNFNSCGKPILNPALELGFNLSHSGNVAVLAIGRAHQIGVDIEEFCPKTDMRSLAESLFSVEEIKSLNHMDDQDLTLPFLTCWTRKEAYLKALGVGLNLDPRTFHVGTDIARIRVPIWGSSHHGFVEVGSIMDERNAVVAVAVTGGFSSATTFDLNQWNLRSKIR